MKNNNSKVLSRLKKVYRTQQNWYYNKVYKFATWISDETEKRCESITDFLKNVKYAKLLKKTRVPYRSKMGQIEQHRKNKHSRVEAKQQIMEGILEWNERYTDDPTCFNCEFYTQEPEPYCVKHKQSRYWDDCVCSDFRD